MPIVVFAVPTGSKKPSYQFTRGALSTMDACHRAGWGMHWNFRPGDPYISKCRSVMASEFLHENKNSDDFFFLDDDIGWPGSAAVRLLERPEDVIAGVYPHKNEDGHESFPVELLHDADTLQPIRRDHLVLASLVPTGFLRIKRHVLEACAKESGIYPHPDSRKGEIEVYDLFRNGFIPREPSERRGRWWGEDFFFSFMVRQLGFEVWVDPDIDFTHSGEHAWTGNFAKAIAEKQATIAELKKAAA